jgi:hypothetical protein
MKSQSKIRHIQRANLILERRYLKEEETPTLPETIYWLSCDGHKNTLSDIDKNKIRYAGEEKNGLNLYYFSEIPKDKGEKDPKFDVIGCVGVDMCEDGTNCKYRFVIGTDGVMTTEDML